MIITITQENAEILRRRSFATIQKLHLEITRHRQQFPNDLQDTTYLDYLQSQTNKELEIFNVLQNALRKLEGETAP